MALWLGAGPSVVRARAGRPPRAHRPHQGLLLGRTDVADPLAVAASLDVLAVCLAAGMAVSTAAAATAAVAPPRLARGRRPCARDTGRRSRRHRRGGFVRMGRPRLRPPARMLARHTRLLRQRRGFDVRRRLAPWGARCCWTRRTGSGRCNRLGPRRWRRCRSRLRVWSGSWGNGRGRGCRCGRGDRGGDRRDRGWLAWCARFDRGHRGDRLARGHRRDGECRALV